MRAWTGTLEVLSRNEMVPDQGAGPPPKTKIGRRRSKRQFGGTGTGFLETWFSDILGTTHRAENEVAHTAG